MMRQSLYGILITLITLGACSGTAQEIVLVSNGSSTYKIVTPGTPTKQEQKAAKILQQYVEKVSGTVLDITTESSRPQHGIYIGNTNKAEKVNPGKRKPESYMVRTDLGDLVICAGSGKGLTYGVYYFIEAYLHCKKLSGEPAIVPANTELRIPGRINDERQPAFVYREAYYPAAHDAEYLEWNQLQQLDDLWGVWGHSFNKLVPAQTYFRTHPEYYSLVKGRRQAMQLCLSNEDVFKILTTELRTRMNDNPDALYWSVSPNDDNGYCTCDKCRATDDEHGGPSGSLIQFVNRVAAMFPDKKITTLAYAYTHKAPRNLKPAENVYVFLSNIDAYRDKPLAEEGSAGAFRNDLKAWGSLTKNIFIWDYITQFTNYLAPFPNFHTLGPNMKYYKDNGVRGIFAQGSGDTYGEWAELRSYVEAKLYQDPGADVKPIIASFIKDYYGKAGKYLQEYADMVQEQMIASKRKLDIYGNPVNEWNKYLSPALIERYAALFDKAEGAAEGNALLLDRVKRARLPLEYTALQQARFYGIEQHGVFVKDNSGRWAVKPKLEEKVKRFVAECKNAGVTELSEAGENRKPDEYMQEWAAIFKTGVIPTIATGASVTLQYPFAEDYPAKGNRTLIDGSPGYSDFSYNWLCFYGTPMVATVDLGTAKRISKVQVNFLDDPRHWIFQPEKVNIEVSGDGVTYHSIGSFDAPRLEEHYNVSVSKRSANRKEEKARYVRVTAYNMKTLPEWRYRDGKKAMIACDEIFVQ